MSTETDKAVVQDISPIPIVEVPKGKREVSFIVPDGVISKDPSESYRNYGKIEFPDSAGPYKRCNCLVPTKRKRSTPPPQSLYNISNDSNIEQSFSEQEKLLFSSVRSSHFSLFNRIKNWFSKAFSSQYTDSAWL